MLDPHRPHRLNSAGPRRRLGTLVSLVSLAVLLTGCKVDVQLGIRVKGNGSGVVQARFSADREAVEAIGGDVSSRSDGAARALEKRLRVADLIQAGWKVEIEDMGDDEDDGGGGVTIVLEKGFANPPALTAVVEELSGDAGPFRDFRLTRKSSTFRTDFTFAGKVDLDAGIGGTALDPADEGIAPELADEDVTADELAQFLRERIDRAFEITVVVDMPGGGSHNAPGELAGAPQWSPSIGEAAELRAESSDLASDRLALVAFGLLLAGIATAMTLRWRAAGRKAEADQPSREPV